MQIPASLAHRLNNDLQEAIGALDLALVRIQQSKDAMRKAAEFIAVNTDHRNAEQ